MISGGPLSNRLPLVLLGCIVALTVAARSAWTMYANVDPLAALLWRLRLRDHGRLRLAFAAVAWTLIEIISWPFTRYHFPLLPVISVLAAAFVVRVWDAVVARGRAHDSAP
jgi:hypothetical protein